MVYFEKDKNGLPITMRWAPYNVLDYNFPFGQVRQNNEIVKFIYNDQSTNIAFKTKDETSKFVADFEMTALLYSMEIVEDLECKIEENVKESPVTKNSICLQRGIEINENNIKFVIGEKKYPLLNASEALEKIKQRVTGDGVIDLSQRLWGTEQTAYITSQIFLNFKPRFTEEQGIAMFEFSNYGFQEMTKFLLGNVEYNDYIENYEKWNKRIEDIKKLTNAMKPLEEDIWLYRSESDEQRYGFDENSQNGYLRRLVSTSTSQNSCQSFNHHNILCKIKVPKGTPVLFMVLSEVIKRTNENEVLLPPILLKINGIQRGGDIKLESQGYFHKKSEQIEYEMEVVEVLSCEKIINEQLERFRKETIEQAQIDNIHKK